MRSALDCLVPRLTLLFFSAAEDLSEAARMVTAGTAWLQLSMQANGAMGRSCQAALRPVKRCTTKETTARISRM